MTAGAELNPGRSFIMDENSMEVMCLSFDLAFFAGSRCQSLDEFKDTLCADFQINGNAVQAVLARAFLGLFHDDVSKIPSHLPHLIQGSALKRHTTINI